MQYPNHQPAAGQQGQHVIPSFPAPPPPPLPPGWEQANDPASGRIYYANRATGETSWTPPLFPPMLQPPPMQLVQQTNTDMYHQQQMMLASAPVAAVQPQQQIMMAQPDNMNIPVNNVSMQSNYSTHQQQYVPNQPQVVLHTTSSSEPSNIIHSVMQPNSHVQTPQQLETQTQSRINSNTSSGGGGLGPSTATSQGMLVPSIRAMINEEYTQRVNQQQAGSVQSPPPKLELEGLTAGAIADLCNVTRELKSRNNVDGGDFAENGGGIDIEHKQQQQGQEGDDDEEQYYAPLQPFTLPVSAIPPLCEPGRVDIRLHALHTKLGKI